MEKKGRKHTEKMQMSKQLSGKKRENIFYH